MRMLKKVALVLASATMVVGLASVEAPTAHAGDTGWGCGNCRPGR
ncbi:hypothetical protein [Nocardioides sp.]